MHMINVSESVDSSAVAPASASQMVDIINRKIVVPCATDLVLKLLRECRRKDMPWQYYLKITGEVKPLPEDTPKQIRIVQAKGSCRLIIRCEGRSHEGFLWCAGGMDSRDLALALLTHADVHNSVYVPTESDPLPLLSQIAEQKKPHRKKKVHLPSAADLLTLRQLQRRVKSNIRSLSFEKRQVEWYTNGLARAKKRLATEKLTQSKLMKKVKSFLKKTQTA
ncbi:MAG TPA: hypothetical protein VIR98_00020 [Candidatus Paceibacterota bacterium]